MLGVAGSGKGIWVRVIHRMVNERLHCPSRERAPTIFEQGNPDGSLVPLVKRRKRVKRPGERSLHLKQSVVNPFSVAVQ
jgi:hypothetical protein